MKTEKNILIAFILNLSFSFFEFAGGLFSGSVAIISDAIHDIGDATSIGISYFLEKKSKKHPDETHTYGYVRYSLIGGLINTLILLLSSVVVIVSAVNRIFNPVEINYNGMIIFSVIGVCVNFCAAFFTRKGTSLNQKTVNLHMLEDVLGWFVVLIGAIVMHFTDFAAIDPIMSVGVATFILFNAFKNLKEIIDIFLEKTPHGIEIQKIKEHISGIAGVLDVHHIHVRSLDGQNNYATMHIVAETNFYQIKKKVREELKELGIVHVTIEIEAGDENCSERNCCEIPNPAALTHHHHHHHHHH